MTQLKLVSGIRSSLKPFFSLTLCPPQVVFQAIQIFGIFKEKYSISNWINCNLLSLQKNSFWQ